MPDPFAEEVQVLDQERLLREVGHDRDVIVRIIEMFQTDSRIVLVKLRDGVVRQKPRVVEQAAHRLMGSLGALAAGAALQAASRLESLGRAGALASAQEALTALEDELARLEPELRRLNESLRKKGLNT